MHLEILGDREAHRSSALRLAGMARRSIDSPADERELLEAVRGGDREAYGRLVEPYRSLLHAHCYRMLGSVHDAEDALQDTLLRAWRGLPRFEGRSSLRSWLFRIATNASLRLIERRPGRVLPIEHGPAAALHEAPGEPLVESVWVEPYPDRELGVADGLAAPEARYEQRESVELAFVAALQHLPARQRAALILHEVLGFSAREVAESLDTTVASVYSALQRARRGVDERVPAQSQQATLRSLGDEGQRQVVERYLEAWERGDVDALVALLVEDATWSMPPVATWYRGVEAIAGFLTEWPLRHRWRRLPARANGQLAVGCYMWDGEAERYNAHVLDVLTVRGARIEAVTGFITPAVFPHFGLPDSLA
jgi:RNA polymerase sigma-70 factor (ECF subfamily)